MQPAFQLTIEHNRASHQALDCQDARPRRAADPARPRRRGDRMSYAPAFCTSRFLLREDRVLDGSDQNLVKRRITRLLVLLTHPQRLLDMNELFGR